MAGVSSAFAQEEIDSLLKAESAGQKWTEGTPNNIMRSWTRSDKAVATYLTTAKIFSIATAAYEALVGSRAFSRDPGVSPRFTACYGLSNGPAHF